MNADRHRAILDYLTGHQTASVHVLAQIAFASEATIRRDLTALEKEGKVRRTFGGAVLAELLNREVPLTLREQENTREKDAIAARAAALVRDGNTIFLDASSTAGRLVRYLDRFQDLTVVTNSPKTSLALGARGIESFCTGGLLLKNSVAYVGLDTCSFFHRFNPDLVFISCRGITEDGILCDSSIEEAGVRKTMLACGGRRVFLCDTSKFAKRYRCNIAPLSAVDQMLSESDVLPEVYARFLADKM